MINFRADIPCSYLNAFIFNFNLSGTVQAFFHDVNKSIIFDNLIFFVFPNRKHTPEDITGPHMRKRDVHDPSYICYSLYDRVNNSLVSVTTPKDPLCMYFYM